MPYMTQTILLAQEMFGKLDGFEPERRLDDVKHASTVGEAAQMLGLIEVLPDHQQGPMREFFAAIPDAVDAGMMAAVRSALARGLRVGISWQPGYDFELRVWDVSDGAEGMVNVHLISPHPVEKLPAH